MTTHYDAFDARIRRHHAQALAQVSAHAHARLQLPRHAGIAPARRGFRIAPAWPLAAACAAGVLAIGLQWRQSAPAPITNDAPAIAESAAVSADEFTSLYSAFDETPDLYLWLASNEAATLAME